MGGLPFCYYGSPEIYPTARYVREKKELHKQRPEEVKAGVPGSGLLQAQEGCPGAKPVKRHYLEIGTWWE